MVLGVLVATFGSFVLSAVLYALPPATTIVARDSRPLPGLSMPAVVASVLARSLVVSCLVAGLMAAAGWSGAGEGLLFGLALGVLPVTILAGAVVHESTPVALAAVHSFDWVAKLVVIGAVVGLFL